jgi:hypothetical protein
MDPTIHWYLVECAGHLLAVLTGVLCMVMIVSLFISIVYFLCLLKSVFDPKLCRHCGKPVTDSPPSKIKGKDF